MIKQSFIFLDKIKNKTELNIWNQNIRTWNDFIHQEKIKGISPARKIFYNQRLAEASNALRNDDSSYFINMPETWRLYDYFKEEAVFLDIEISNKHRDITIIGLFDGFDTKMFVKGFNLDKELLKNVLSKYKLIITFNGGSFDLPTLQKYFDDVLPDIPHIDLRHICARVGLTGGLKEIEKRIGINRPSIVRDMYGGDPTLLWKKYLATGNKRFIDLLIQYNEEDIINLKIIAEQAIKKLWNAKN